MMETQTHQNQELPSNQVTVQPTGEFASPENQTAPSSSPPKKYWRSLEEFHGDPELMASFQNEFMSSPMASEDGKDGVARREFLKLMGASLAMVSTTACVRRPVQKIVPYSKIPEGMVQGVANYYSSSWAYGGEGFGLVVKTREGRPLKIEGNPAHPSNQGALSARAHAHLLNVYDPDRATGPVKVSRRGESASTTWEELDKNVVSKLKEGGVVLLTSSLGSHSTRLLISDFSNAYGVRHVNFDPLGVDDIVEGQKASYGSAVFPRYRFDLAKMIVSFDCDFLGTLGPSIEYARLFSKSRKLGKEMSKLVSFESVMSLTGSNADLRFRVKPSQQVEAAMALAHELIVKQGRTRYSSDATVKTALSKYAESAEKLGLDKTNLTQVANDLWERRGSGIVIAGGLASRSQQSLALQVVTNFLNSALENDGKTIDHSTVLPKGFEGSYASISDLINDMNAGKVKTLLVYRSNPVFTLPKDSGFTEALSKVGTVVSMNDRVDETSAFADWLAPEHHDLENWNDHEVLSDVYSIQQPTIRPLYNTRAFQSSLMIWAEKRGPTRMTSQESWYGYLRESWKGLHGKSGRGGSFEDFWVKVLHDGVLDLSEKRREGSGSARAFRLAAALDVIAKARSESSGLELVLYPMVGMGDGSLGNIAWLQELPDTVTKCTWDSYITLSPKKAAELKVDRLGWGDGDTQDFTPGVEITVKGEKLSLAVHVQPGQHDDVVGLHVGLGRTRAGRVGNGVGINGFSFASFHKGEPIFAGLAVDSMAKSTKSFELACAQGHHTMAGRQIIAETTLDEYLKNPRAGIHDHHIFSIWPKHEYKGHKWAMSIDQSACIGCSACVVACMSENNIPVVGKKYVLRGREMHWIRIDRYYSAVPDHTPEKEHAADNPTVSFQPMLCQHCDNAPCETVCPVLATTHSPEGLNEMTYNRCVGTRYCSNNCPYKVRRFNWFNYAKEDNNYHLVGRPKNAALNPDVGVRTRGVMEKCTFCVQRIHVAKNEARDQGRRLKDGDVVTACEQTCPTDAIVFGDMNDPESRVSRLFADQRTYGVLAELNTAPAVRYMTKIRNAHKPAGSKDEGAHHS